MKIIQDILMEQVTTALMAEDGIVLINFGPAEFQLIMKLKF